MCPPLLYPSSLPSYCPNRFIPLFYPSPPSIPPPSLFYLSFIINFNFNWGNQNEKDLFKLEMKQNHCLQGKG